MKNKFDKVYNNIINESFGDIVQGVADAPHNLNRKLHQSLDKISTKLAPNSSIKKGMISRIREYLKANGWKNENPIEFKWSRNLFNEDGTKLIVKITENKVFVMGDKNKKDCVMKLEVPGKGSVNFTIEWGAGEYEIKETIREAFKKLNLMDEDKSDSMAAIP